MFEIEKVDMEHIDRIRPLWEKLIQANAANSPYFADYYGTFEFEIRKGFLQEKLDNGAAMYTAVLVDREKKQDAGFVTVTYNRDTSFGEIEMLYLLEEYRGQGMGKKMLVFKGISDDLLQHFQFFIKECFLLIMENGAGAKEWFLSIPFAAAPHFRDFRKGLI